MLCSAPNIAEGTVGQSWCRELACVSCEDAAIPTCGLRSFGTAFDDGRCHCLGLVRLKRSQITLSLSRHVRALQNDSAHGEVGASHAAGSLVDFTRKTGADLAVLTAKASKSKRQSIPETADQLGEDYDDANSKRESNGKKRRRTNAPSGRSSKHNAARESEIEDDRRFSKSQQDDDDEEDDGEGDRDSAEVRIQDEFGRDRTVFRGSSEHKLHLLAKRAAKERQAELVAETEAFDERYSYRGNWGSTHPAASPPPPPPPPPPLPPHAAMSTSASGGTVGNDPAGGWAWSSGVGRGADAGDFETREGQEAIASKKMAELLEREGGGGSETGRDIGGAKVTCYV